MVGKDHKWRIFPKWTQLQPCHMAPFSGSTPHPKDFPYSSFYPQQEKCWILGKTWIALHGWFVSSTVKSNRWYGQASNMGTWLQVVEITCVQVYRPTLNIKLWMLCFLHAKYRIHTGYKTFLLVLRTHF